MSKPLTIEELKALEVGDWVWVVSRLSNIGIYEQIRCSDNTSMFFDSGYCIDYSEYERKWAIYKNKEQAEARGEIVELPCLRDITGRTCKSKKKQLLYVCESGCIHDLIYNEDEFYEAERRLAELKG